MAPPAHPCSCSRLPFAQDLQEFVPQAEERVGAEEEEYMYSDEEQLPPNSPTKTQLAKRSHAEAAAAAGCAPKRAKAA